MNQHGGNDNEDPDDIPQFIRNEENDSIRDVYSTSRNHIMAHHQRGELRHIYTLCH